MAKYGKSASKNVESTMRRKKKGTLKSGSGRKVKSRKQAIAIELSGLPVMKRTTSRKAARPGRAHSRTTTKTRRWSQKVAERSDALDLTRGVFTSDDPRRIYR